MHAEYDNVPTFRWKWQEHDQTMRWNFVSRIRNLSGAFMLICILNDFQSMLLLKYIIFRQTSYMPSPHFNVLQTRWWPHILLTAIGAWSIHLSKFGILNVSTLSWGRVYGIKSTWFFNGSFVLSVLASFASQCCSLVGPLLRKST